MFSQIKFCWFFNFSWIFTDFLVKFLRVIVNQAVFIMQNIDSE